MNTKTNKLLTAVVVLQALTLAGQWFNPTYTSNANAQEGSWSKHGRSPTGKVEVDALLPPVSTGGQAGEAEEVGMARNIVAIAVALAAAAAPVAIHQREESDM